MLLSLETYAQIPVGKIHIVNNTLLQTAFSAILSTVLLSTSEIILMR